MNDSFSIVGIGSSAGRLQVLKTLLALIPQDINAAFVLVPHLYAGHKSTLVEILAPFANLNMMWFENGLKIKPQNIYVIPENTIMTVKNGLLSLRPRRTDEIVNTAVDVFFTSLAVDAENKAVGVVLSGCGQDGLTGSQAISNNGGTVITQEPNTAEFPFMPKALVTKDHPDYLLSPAEIAIKIAEHANRFCNDQSIGRLK